MSGWWVGNCVLKHNGTTLPIQYILKHFYKDIKVKIGGGPITEGQNRGWAYYRGNMVYAVNVMWM